MKIEILIFKKRNNNYFIYISNLKFKIKLELNK